MDGGAGLEMRVQQEEEALDSAGRKRSEGCKSSEYLTLRRRVVAQNPIWS